MSGLFNGKTLDDIRNESRKECREKYIERQIQEKRRQEHAESVRAEEEPTELEKAENKVQHIKNIALNMEPGSPAAIRQVKTCILEISEVMEYILSHSAS